MLALYLFHALKFIKRVKFKKKNSHDFSFFVCWMIFCWYVIMSFEHYQVLKQRWKVCITELRTLSTSCELRESSPYFFFSPKQPPVKVRFLKICFSGGWPLRLCPERLLSFLLLSAFFSVCSVLAGKTRGHGFETYFPVIVAVDLSDVDMWRTWRLSDGFTASVGLISCPLSGWDADIGSPLCSFTVDEGLRTTFTTSQMQLKGLAVSPRVGGICLWCVLLLLHRCGLDGSLGFGLLQRELSPATAGGGASTRVDFRDLPLVFALWAFSVL